jgi:hypothetical protein
LLNALPETVESASFVKDYYDREKSEKKYESGWREAVKRWLTYHSSYFSDELARVAEQAGDTGEYVTHQNELLALARVDWEKARPILERLLNDRSQPISQTLARWAFYERAVREKDSVDAEKYRKELQRRSRTNPTSRAIVIWRWTRWSRRAILKDATNGISRCLKTKRCTICAWRNFLHGFDDAFESFAVG